MTKRTNKDGATRIRWEIQIDGVRYTGTSANKREAARDKKAKRAEVEGGAGTVNVSGANKAGGRGLTLEAACALYWRDAQRLRSAADIERRLGIVKRLIGPATPLAAIRYATVAQAIRDRLAEPGPGGRALTGASANRDVIDTLRPALKAAALEHELTLPAIDWGKLRQKEAGEIVCEFTDEQVAAWARELSCWGERLFLRTALTYAPRLGELFFPPAALKLDAPGGPELELGRYLGRGGVWRETRKDGSLHTVALLEEDAALLAEQAAKAGEGADHIWTDEAGRPISYYAMAGRLRRAAKRAGIAQARVVHGMRHHGVTAIVRKAGLLMGQQLAGHRQITTTRRYAHASKADMRAALAGGAATESPTKTTPKAPPLTR